MTVETLERPSLWDTDEREAWTPPPQLTPAQWAERYRILPRGQTARPGRWRNANAPYLRGIMNLAAAAGVSFLAIVKAAQIGVSEALRNVAGFWADTDPDPLGLALPDRQKGRRIVDNRVIPMFRDTPRLRRLTTARAKDTQAEQLRLRNGFIIHLLWSGSPSALASDPMRYAIADEVDKFSIWAGREGDPVGLISKRLTTYEGRSKLIAVSTPTNREGRIYVLWDGCSVKLYFYVPCPHCQTYQRLVFAQVKWKKYKGTKSERADKVARNRGGAWYDCIQCRRKITEDQRRAIVTRGRYATEDGSIKDAEAVTKWPAGTRLGIQINALVCLWTSLNDIAAEWIRAEGDLAASWLFRTQVLGEPFEQQVTRTKAGTFADKSRRAKVPAGVVPSWGTKLLATIDTQHDHFYAVVRAWSAPMRSHRVWHGRLDTFDQIDALLARAWPIEAEAFSPLRIESAFIDSGGTKLEADIASRTMQVYEYCLGRSALVKPIKGASRTRRTRGLFLWPGKGFVETSPNQTQRRRRSRGRAIRVWFLDTDHFADLLADMVGRHVAPDDPKSADAWTLNSHNDPVYNSHLSNVRKIAIRDGGGLRLEWAPVQTGARHDYWDAEVYQIALAYYAQVPSLPPPETVAKVRKAHAEEIDRRRRSAAGEKPDPWTPKPLKRRP